MALNWTSIEDWLRQPTTILGVATIAGTIAEGVNRELSWAAAAPVIAGGLVAIVWPEQPSTKAAVEQTVKDGLAVVVSKGSAGSTMTLGTDLVTVAGLLHPNTPVVAVQTTVTPIAPALAPAAPVSTNTGV